MVCYQMVTPNDVDQEHDINVLKQERGATVDVQDSSGNTALHLTCSGKTGFFAIFYVLSNDKDLIQPINHCQEDTVLLPACF